MSRFRITRRSFLGTSAGAATLGLAGCAGGTTTGGGLPANGSTPTAAPPTGGSTPGASVTATPEATPNPGSTTTAVYPNGTISVNSRGPNSLPDPTKPAGTPNAALPFDTVIIIMMENHSFDNYLGMLPVRGHPAADGVTFVDGVPQNKNPLDGGYQHVFHLRGTCGPYPVTQSWDVSHMNVDNGTMSKFATTSNAAMGYWDETDIPFYYSLAKTFCVGNRAFCSVQGQTYPNRRYLYSGTSVGLVSTSDTTFTLPYPANGTLMDMMSKHGVSWKAYFLDLPTVAIIPQTIEKYPANFASNAEYYADAAAGLLPNVSFVDPGFNAGDEVGSPIAQYLNMVPDLPSSITLGLENTVEAQGTDEEGPSDIAIGEQFTARVVNAALKSPQWKSMLLIWTYDEHGGYYDHVPPMGAVEPDDIQPLISATDYQAKFNVTGVRVPFVVASPYARPNSVSNTPHDHTAIIATIAAKWNLPAITYRDAQSPTLLDYLDLESPPAFLTPPTLATPAEPESISGGYCATGPPPPNIQPDVKRGYHARGAD